MAGALFNRIKIFTSLSNLFFSELNNEFNNILTNFRPDKMDDLSASVAAMRETLSPGAVGTEAPAVSLAEEVQQLRFMLKAISGGDQWYSSPSATLEELVGFVQTLSGHRIISGRADANGQPMFLVPNSGSAGCKLEGAPTNFVAQIAGEQRTFTADITLSGLSLAPSSNNTAAVNDASLAGANATRIQGERYTQITIGTIGSEISALNGKLAAFKLVHSATTEYFLATVDTTNNRLINCWRGAFFNNSDAWIPRLAVSNADVITLMKIAWIFGTYNADTAGLDVTYNQPIVSPTQPSSPSIGDFWFDLVNSTWKKYNGTSFATTAAIPIGITIQDSAATVAGRSFDFSKNVSGRASIDLWKKDSGSVQAKYLGSVVEVYGTNFTFDAYLPTWTMADDLDSGETDDASKTYYVYVTNTGLRKLTTVAPFDRRNGLYGFYHPAKPWRCIGAIDNDGSSNFDADTLGLLHWPQPMEYFPNPIFNGTKIQIGGPTNGAILTGAATGTLHLGPAGTAEAAFKAATARTIAVKTGGAAVEYGLVVSPYATHGKKVVHGHIAADGSTTTGTGFTSAKTATGTYEITFSSAFNANYTGIACLQNANGVTIAVAPRIVTSISSTTVLLIRTFTDASTNNDLAFFFIAIGERGD